MTRTNITLHEIRRVASMGNTSMGARKLRTKARATKLRAFLNRRYNIKTETHAWKIKPTAAEWARLERLGA